ncbi:MAG TPA: acyl-CoA thioesterase [Ruminiclostridium sp.]|nr:acyl-CoA thioesterase [Ruminiclostridium sp.]
MTTRTLFPVRYSEIDTMGIVHHSNYPKWFEIGRIDYLHKAGISDSSINRHGFYLPLCELECKFKSPAKYGDEIIVITGITFVSCVKVRFEYKVLNKRSGKTIAVGSTVHAWTDREIKPLNIEKAAPQIYTSLKTSVEIGGINEDEDTMYIHKQ